MLKHLAVQPGITRDLNRYMAAGVYWDSNWVRFHLGAPMTIGGYRKLSTATYTGICRSMHGWSALDGVHMMGLGTTTGYFIYSGGTMYDLTPAGFTVLPDYPVGSPGYGVGTYGIGPYGTFVIVPGGTTAFPPARGQWSQGNWGQDLVGCVADVGHGLYYWTYDPTFAADLVTIESLPSGSDVPIIARMILVTDDRHVIAFGVNEAGKNTQDVMNVRWSDIENVKNWTPSTTTEAGSYRLTHGSEIVSSLATRQENLIWTDSALYSMKYIGPPYIFGFTLAANSISIMSMRAPVDNGSAVFWMGMGNFYAYSGSVQILPCSIRDYVFGDFNFDYANTAHGGINRAFSEIWWFYPSAGSVDINRYAVYNWTENIWYFGALSRTAWMDPSFDRYPWAANGGFIYQHELGDDGDGAPIQKFLESGDLELNDGHTWSFCKRFIPDIHFTGTNPAPSMTISVSFKSGPEAPASKTVSGTYTPGSTVFVRGRGRAATYRIESFQLGTSWKGGMMRADIQPDGRKA